MFAKKSLDKSEWVVRHRPPQYHIHNHEPSRASVSHPFHRTLSAKAINEIEALSGAGIEPRDIRNVLQEKGFSNITKVDVPNQIAEARRGCETAKMVLRHY